MKNMTSVRKKFVAKSVLLLALIQTTISVTAQPVHIVRYEFTGGSMAPSYPTAPPAPVIASNLSVINWAPSVNPFNGNTISSTGVGDFSAATVIPNPNQYAIEATFTPDPILCPECVLVPDITFVGRAFGNPLRVQAFLDDGSGYVPLTSTVPVTTGPFAFYSLPFTPTILTGPFSIRLAFAASDAPAAVEIDNLQFNFICIPEPTQHSALLVIATVLAILAFKRRKSVLNRATCDLVTT